MIYNILGAPCLAYLLILAFQWHLRFPILDRRPFNCIACLSAWLGLLLYLLPSEISHGAASFALAGVLGIVIYKQVSV